MLASGAIIGDRLVSGPLGQSFAETVATSEDEIAR